MSRLVQLANAHDFISAIIVLKDGVVAEQGTHDELVAMGGVYAEPHRIQYEQPGGSGPARGASAPSSPPPASAP